MTRTATACGVMSLRRRGRTLAWYWVTVSRDATWAASGGGNHKVPPPTAGSRGNGFLNAFEVATGNPQRLLNANDIGGVNAVALSGDGTHLIAGADAAYIYERTGKTFGAPVILKDGMNPAERQNIVSVAISDDGQSMIYGTSTQTGGRLPAVSSSTLLRCRRTPSCGMRRRGTSSSGSQWRRTARVSPS